MIEKLLALFERFVTAHERLAASQEAMLNNCMCGSTDLIDEIKEAVSGPLVTPQPEPAKVEDTAPVDTAAAWNPFLEPVQGRYGKDKAEILDAEIAKRGIGLKASATGPEKHQALLDWSAKGADPMPAETTQEPAAPVEPAVDPAVDPTVEVPEEVTIEMVRALAQKAMTGANKLDAKAVQDLFEAHAGVRRLPEIPADKLGAVYAALTNAVGV